MQPVEALQRLIIVGDVELKQNSTYGTEQQELSPNEEDLALAVAVCQAMLNTALPVARFRCFVRMESGKEKGREFTICSPNIEDIVVALYPLSLMARFVYISLWEQRADGASMIEGFQGNTRPSAAKKAPNLRLFLDSLRKYAMTTAIN